MKKFLKVQQVLGKNLRSGGSKIVSKETLAYETGQKAESVNKLENLKKAEIAQNIENIKQK